MASSYRKSTQTRHRSYPQADNQRFQVNRSRLVKRSDGRGYAFAPHRAYWREASCEEAGCPHFLNGWQMELNLDPLQSADELKAMQDRLAYIANHSERSYTEAWDGSTVRLYFTPGQRCFKSSQSPHTIPVERDPQFLIARSGRGQRQVDYDEFFDEFNEINHLLDMRQRTG